MQGFVDPLHGAGSRLRSASCLRNLKGTTGCAATVQSLGSGTTRPSHQTPVTMVLPGTSGGHGEAACQGLESFCRNFSKRASGRGISPQRRSLWGGGPQGSRSLKTAASRAGGLCTAEVGRAGESQSSEGLRRSPASPWERQP